MRLRTGPIVLVLVAGLAAAGCGGDGDKIAATTPPPPTVTSLLTTTQPGAPARAGSADEAAGRLRGGGYTVATIAVNPPARAARRIGGNVLLYEYASTAAARDGAVVIKNAIGQNPDRGVVDAEGRRVYFLGERHAVTADERAAFADLVDIGEGR